MTQIEKRPGTDWIVTVRVPDEGELYPVSIFGAATQALAVTEALASFHVTIANPAGHEIVSVEKLTAEDGG